MKPYLGLCLLAAALMSGCAGSPPPPTSAPTAAPKAAASPAAAAAASPAPAAPAPSPAAKPAQSPSPAASPAAARPADTSAANANPRDALSKAFLSWGDTKTFRAKMTITDPTNGNQEINYDVVLPNSLHMKSPFTEAIVANGDFYMKLPTGGWQKLPQAFDFDMANPRKLADSMGASTEVKLIGPDVLDGQPMLVYEYTATFAGQGAPAVKPGAKPSAKPESYVSRVWVAVSDGLPRKLEGESEGIKTTAIYYDFNAPITITPPQ